MPRTIQPELLDSLPPDHPDALHNRRDLRLTNRLMGNYRWFVKTLPPLVHSDEVVLEVGAGTGELALQLMARGLRVDGLDRCPPPDEWSATQRWHQSDLRAFDQFASYRVIIANLVLHQFEDHELARLGAIWQKNARVIALCEPARRLLSQVLYRAIAPLLGANHVSLHDAHVSIDAGFRGDELPRALGLEAKAWDIQFGPTFIGACRMVAVRRA